MYCNLKWSVIIITSTLSHKILFCGRERRRRRWSQVTFYLFRKVCYVNMITSWWEGNQPKYNNMQYFFIHDHWSAPSWLETFFVIYFLVWDILYKFLKHGLLHGDPFLFGSLHVLHFETFSHHKKMREYYKLTWNLCGNGVNFSTCSCRCHYIPHLRRDHLWFYALDFLFNFKCWKGENRGQLMKFHW